MPMGTYLEWFRTCSRITVTAHPAVAVPAGFTDDGLPIGAPARRPPPRRARAAAARARDQRSDRAARNGRRRSDAVAARRLRRPRTAPPIADAEPRPFWLDHAARGVARAHRRHRRRPVHRRRRLHRAVGGALRQGARSRARRRPARGRDGRLRRQRPQRRLRDRVAHARDRQRPRALRGRDAGAGAARAGELRRPGRRSRPLRDRLRLRAHRRPARADRRLPGAPGSRRRRRRCAASATRRRCSTAPAMRAEVASPTYRGGVWDRTGSGIVDPGKLAAGLRDAAIRAGVRVYEHSAVARHRRSTS